jgi:isopentenyl-diphosphate Delta-isomerase
MEEVTPIGLRKSEHIRINLEEDVQSGLTTGLEQYHFIHRALPEIDLREVDPSVTLFGKHLSAPILISSMTGGTSEASRINQVLATAAQETHIAMGVGSQRIALEHPDLADTFQVRQVAPDILLFANLGAIQLNYGYGIEACQRAIDMINADALVLHFNAIQEAVQNEGETQFAGLLTKVKAVCKALAVPVIAKEVGWGFSKQDIALLAQAGVTAIDVAGAGGTSWSQVEMYRAEKDTQRKLAAAFSDWGIPTVEAIQNVIQVAPGLKIIASGGLRDGVDIAKCVALGAVLGGMAGPFLKTATQSVDVTVKLINLIKEELSICMFATGSRTLDQLRQDRLVKK